MNHIKTLLLALVFCCVCTVAHAQQRICTKYGCYTVQSVDRGLGIVDWQKTETQTTIHKSQSTTKTKVTTPRHRPFRLRFWR